jgi:hypothetical protein
MPQIEGIHQSHTIGGANSTTMVVMFVDCCVGCYGTFGTIPTSQNQKAALTTIYCYSCILLSLVNNKMAHTTINCF